MTVSSKDARLFETMHDALDNATVGKAFGTPIEHDGMILLPVAKVGGGAGGGSGTGPGPEGQETGGTGGGVGLSTKPLGVFVLKNGKVTWRPAVDVNRIILGGQLVAVTALLVARALIQSRQSTNGQEKGRRPFVRRAAGRRCG
jgi:uncharacterized spore protein YtfJ